MSQSKNKLRLATDHKKQKIKKRREKWGLEVVRAVKL